MIELHHYPATAAMVPHIVLEEIGVPYRRVHVDRMADAHKKPAYLRLNPNGLIPVLVDGDMVLYETAAIVLYLCDRYPQAGLAPAPGAAERSHFYKWLVWSTNTFQAALMLWFYPERWVDAGNTDGAAQVKRHAQVKVAGLLDQLEAQLTAGGPWFMGDAYSAVDAYLFTLCRWTRNFPCDRARDRPALGPFLQRVLQRPTVQRVIANEGLQPPYV
jgi:glutathione S-transferase